jgi:pentose-5-phosphate-3-epimerase
VKVQVDGGVTHKNAMRLVLAGADMLNSGSFISASLDPTSAKRSLEREVQRGLKERRIIKR